MMPGTVPARSGCAQPRAGRTAAGFTLAEVLMALALLAVVLLVVGYFTIGSVRTYRAALQVLEQAQAISIAEDVILQEVGLAGYGLPLQAPGGQVQAAVQVHVDPHPGRSDSVRVRYLEERWRAAAEVQDITIDVTSDSQGNRNLYRKESGANRQPAVQGVTNLKLFRFIDTDGLQLDPAGVWPQWISGLVLVLSFEWDAERFVVVQFGTPQLLGTLAGAG